MVHCLSVASPWVQLLACSSTALWCFLVATVLRVVVGWAGAWRSAVSTEDQLPTEKMCKCNVKLLLMVFESACMQTRINTEGLGKYFDNDKNVIWQRWPKGCNTVSNNMWYNHTSISINQHKFHHKNYKDVICICFCVPLRAWREWKQE